MTTDIFIHRIEKYVHIMSKHMDRHYELVDDNTENSPTDFYVISIKTSKGITGEIILPKATTNVIVIG